MSKEVYESCCERCGKHALGSQRLMFHGDWLARFPGPPIGRDFFCLQCQRAMRGYGVIGLLLLSVIAVAAIAAYLWVRSLAGP